MHELPEPIFLEEHMKEARKAKTGRLVRRLSASSDRGAELNSQIVLFEIRRAGQTHMDRGRVSCPPSPNRSRSPFDVDFDTSINCIDRHSGHSALRRIPVFWSRINLQGGLGLMLLGLSARSEHL